MIGVLKGLVGLAGFWVSLRGRTRGRYMAWRMQTAYGPRGASPRTKHRDALVFGRWWVRMRRMP